MEDRLDSQGIVARKAHYGNAADLVADLAAVGINTNTATISRIEKGTDVPTGANRQTVAVGTMVLCGVKPARLGLALDVLPLRVYAELFPVSPPDSPSGQVIPSPGCFNRTARHDLVGQRPLLRVA